METSFNFTHATSFLAAVSTIIESHDAANWPFGLVEGFYAYHEDTPNPFSVALMRDVAAYTGIAPDTHDGRGMLLLEIFTVTDTAAQNYGIVLRYWHNFEMRYAYHLIP